jgi:radical SAM superfamily enzyme YgiQ (UPF0313 family)
MKIERKRMKLLLVSPCQYEHRRLHVSLRIPQISLNIIAALTPSYYEIKIVEEEIEVVNFDEDCDIVGISTMTANAPRAYKMAMEFKKRGKTVVIGGVHPTVLPHESIQYADAIVIGEAEDTWGILLNDFEQGKLQRFYTSHQPDASLSPLPRRELSQKSNGLFNVKPIVTTRGCPYDCDFCCVPQFFGKKLRSLPVEKVVEDVIASKGKIFLFLDDNIIGHPKYAKELFKALIPLKIKWVGQASVSFVKDTELMKLAAQSGCAELFFGLESVSTSTLKKMRKSINELTDNEEAIKKVKGFGIVFHASMVFGFDEDGRSIFDETLEFLMRNKIASVTFNILTPYPGTRIYDRFKKEGRLITEEWQYYDHNTVVFRPKNMTTQELLEGHLYTRKQFYKISSIVKRLSHGSPHPLLYIAMNFGYRKSIKEDTKNLQNETTRLRLIENIPDIQCDLAVCNKSNI